MLYKLKDIFFFFLGKTPSRNNIEYWNTNDYKWVSIADLTKTDKYIYDTKEYLSKKAVNESGIKIIPANTVIMSFKLSIGKTAILQKICIQMKRLWHFTINILLKFFRNIFSICLNIKIGMMEAIKL